ncbi:MAG: hypothetical protein R3C45_12575 [Phycisphaerales bacterium]
MGNDLISIWQNLTAGLVKQPPAAVIANYDITFDRVAFAVCGHRLDAIRRAAGRQHVVGQHRRLARLT